MDSFNLSSEQMNSIVKVYPIQELKPTIEFYTKELLKGIGDQTKNAYSLVFAERIAKCFGIQAAASKYKYHLSMLETMKHLVTSDYSQPERGTCRGVFVLQEAHQGKNNCKMSFKLCTSRYFSALDYQQAANL